MAHYLGGPGRCALELGPAWELFIEGQEDDVRVGAPLNSTLADLLGWRVGHDPWPDWVDDLAGRIEAEAM